ncbi:ribosome-recycling factor [Blattabacterium cuenoti]|uniref:ribosome-recycling factor n=1 Tax=Blattabacterium cuenoti TaxID=1653831 RepID=UPI00163CC680|nr:ribosome-recycling factor [Blattabacterium cuenoti]
MEKLDEILSLCTEEMEKIFNILKKNISQIRLGIRSLASTLEKIKIKYYNEFVPLLEISNILIVDNKNITIQPWDKTIISLIDKTIIDANLGLMPTNKGGIIYIKIPSITEEGRLDLVKKIKVYTEHSKILIRNIRKKNNQHIKKLIISDDLLKLGENKIQNITNKYIKKIDIFSNKKKEEILRI